MNETDTARSTQEVFVVVGAGQAGGEVAQALRKGGFDGRLVVIGDERERPYRRPPLSKAYLSGEASKESLYLWRAEMLDKLRIEFIGGERVVRIDRAGKSLELADGRRLAYDRLALTTGGRSRSLPLAGADGDNVFSLRALADVERMRAYFQPGKRLTIVGGGFIGLEVAASARKLGLLVTVLEGLPRVLARVAGETVSSFFLGVHRAAGVDLRTDVRIEGFDGAPVVKHVRLADGSAIETDFILLGVGQLPNVELAQEAGLEVDNGIVVDECARTSDPDIVAAGDCANFPSAIYGRRMRLESVQNALEQARTAAASMRGQELPYRALPWFWSDQYDLKLQMAGLSTGFDQSVLRGDPETRAFAVFYLREGLLIAVDAVNRPQDFMLAKKLIVAGVEPNPGLLADAETPLKSLLPA